MGNQSRIIALIDMDCFYAQVEQRLRPELWGKPVAVVQYSNRRGGGLLAVSYEARKYGVKRGGMFGDDAKKLCPELTLCYVPICEHSDKADLSRYRNASDEVFRVLNNFDSRIVVERASIDEAFLDLTELVEFIIESEDPSLRYSTSLDCFPTTHVADDKDVNNEEDPQWQYDRKKNLCQWLARACIEKGEKLRLAVAAELIEQVRQKIRDETEFHCSAGIASNKVLAKLICSRHKPKEQTVICTEAIPSLFRFTNIRSIRNLGGKLGKTVMQTFAVETMGELSEIPLERLIDRLPGQATWIYNLAKGIDDEPVRPRDKQTSIAVSKNFPAPLTVSSEVRTWLEGLSKEITKRLIEDQLKNSRTARSLHIQYTTKDFQQFVRTVEIKAYNADAIYKMAWSFLRDSNKARAPDSWDPPIFNLSMSAGRFQDGIDSSSKQITEWILKKAERLVAGEEEVSIPLVTDNRDAAVPIAPSRQEQIEEPGPSYKLDDFLPKSFEEIPKDFMENLPEDIKKELAQYCQHSTADNPGTSGTKPAASAAAKKERNAKRRKKGAPEQDVPSKKISQFFSKK